MAPARRSVGARTMAEAFRLTAEDYGDRVAVRTKDDEVRLTWAELRDRVDALAGGLAKLGVRRGDRVALMLDNRPEFHIADLAAMTLGATPFSIYQTLAPEQVAYVISDAGAKVAIAQSSYLEQLAESPLETVILLDGEAPDTVRLGGGRGRRPRLRRRGRLARGRARRPADADLHVRHDRAAQGRPARAPQPARRRAEHRAHRPVPGRREGDLVAARRAHRRARRAPLHPDRLRDDGHDLPEPARDRGVPAGRAADLVLRRAAHLGEADVGPAGVPDQRRERRAQPRLARGGARARSSSSRPARRSRRSSPPRSPRPTPALFAGLRAMLGLDELVAVNVGAAPTPRQVLVFFHAIGVPVAELWGMSETCGAGCCNPPDRVKIGTVGPAGAGRGDQAGRRRRAAGAQRRS